MSRYRFKTEQEFKDEGRWDYIYECPYGWSPEKSMNKYLGKDVPKGVVRRGLDRIVLYDCNTSSTWIFKRRDCVLK